jgi:hypothetical protein
MPKFVANWQLQGLTEKPLEAGMEIELSNEEAEFFLADGVLSRLADSSTTLDELTAAELVRLAAKDFGFKLDPTLDHAELLAVVKDLGEREIAEGGQGASPSDDSTSPEALMVQYRSAQNKQVLSDLALANLGLSLDPEELKREDMEAQILAHLMQE